MLLDTNGSELAVKKSRIPMNIVGSCPFLPPMPDQRHGLRQERT